MVAHGWFCPRCGHDAGTAGTCPRDGEPLVRVSQHDLLGRELGEYKVLASLGGGSFGSVYRAVHSRSGMIAAIKLLHRPIDDAESKRVLIEARAAAMLNHPNVVQVYDLGLTGDRRPYIVMQLLDGQSLAHLLSQRMEVRIVVSIACDVLSALDAAHARGVIHRDLKPDNIFVTKGRAMIVDFGLAKLIADPRAPSLTATGEALGTPHYMAPEQVRGELADGRADLYALGCVMFEMLAGRPPFEGSATFAIFDAQLHKQPPSITQIRSDVPPAIEATIAKALAKDPGSRFANARAMKSAMVGVVAPRKRWPIAAAIGGVALAGLVAVGAFVAPASPAPGSGSTNSPGPVRPKEAVVVPPPLDGEPPLDPKLEQGLTMMAANIEGGLYKRADFVTLRCAIEPAHSDPSPHVPPTLRAYARRLVKLLQTHQPDLDPAVDCKTPPAPPSTRRIAAPAAQPDELPLDQNLETVISTLHEQLDLGRIDASAARAMHCDFARQDRESIAERGSVPRKIRGMHRRIGILLEAYHPGVTRSGCR